MPNYAIVVEGSHDASFLGRLLKVRGFKAANKLSAVPNDWQQLFPKSFPMDGETLERVMRFPEIFIKDDLVVGITTAGSDNRLVSTLRSVVDAMGASAIKGIAVFIDIDKHDVDSRFSAVQKQVAAMNKAALEELQPGYPIVVPNVPGVMERGQPALGIFLFPDNSKLGALEDILVACAYENHPDIASAAVELVVSVDRDFPADRAELKQLRSGMGKSKATVGIIANLLKPGVSIASSLAQTNWLAYPAIKHELVDAADAFLGSLLKN